MFIFKDEWKDWRNIFFVVWRWKMPIIEATKNFYLNIWSFKFLLTPSFDYTFYFTQSFLCLVAVKLELIVSSNKSNSWIFKSNKMCSRVISVLNYHTLPSLSVLNIFFSTFVMIKKRPSTHILPEIRTKIIIYKQ